MKKIEKFNSKGLFNNFEFIQKIRKTVNDIIDAFTVRYTGTKIVGYDVNGKPIYELSITKNIESKSGYQDIYLIPGNIDRIISMDGVITMYFDNDSTINATVCNEYLSTAYKTNLQIEGNMVQCRFISQYEEIANSICHIRIRYTLKDGE